MSQVIQKVAAIGTPALLGGVIGGLGMYYGVEATCKSFKQKPWIAGLVGTLTGVGGGFLISYFVFNALFP